MPSTQGFAPQPPTSWVPFTTPPSISTFLNTSMHSVQLVDGLWPYVRDAVQRLAFELIPEQLEASRPSFVGAAARWRIAYLI